jgi:DNA-binding response OmpR family regulator
MAIILLSQDLMVISQVSGMAAQPGSSVRAVSSAADAVQACMEQTPELIVIDLGTPAFEVGKFVQQLKATVPTPPRLVAFGPHVHVDRLTAARDAGCEVMSRGQFFAQLSNVLSG